MAIYTDTKQGPGGNDLDGDVESAWTRVEPLLTPELLQAEHLFGIPLVSGMPDPVTRRVAVMTPELLQRFITKAALQLELEIGIHIFQTRRKERLPFDKQEFASFGFFRLQKRPISSIEKLSIESSDGTNFFSIPLNWIDTGQLPAGQINILPLSPGGAVSGAPGGLIYMQLLQGMQWIPSYFTVEYTVGWPDNMLPVVINDLIGTQAAITILGVLAATHARTTSTSLGIDGMSQSVGTPGPQLFDAAITKLEAQKKTLVNKVKKKVGLGLFVGNV